MFKWEKKGLIFEPKKLNVHWMSEFAQAPSTHIFDNFLRVYFSTRSPKDEAGQFVSHSSYIDLDKTNLYNIVDFAKKPILTLGSKGCFDEFGTYPVSTIKFKNRFLVYYAGWTRCASVPFNTAIGIAFSDDDGKTFKKLGDGPVIAYSPDEPFLLSGPKIRFFNNRLYLFYVAGKKWMLVDDKPEMMLKIRMATSSDGLNWVKHNKDLITNTQFKFESQASPDVCYINGKYHMFFDYWDPVTFRKTQLREIGYATSDDLTIWHREKCSGIEPSSIDSFDSKMVAYPHIFQLNSETFMFYLGNDVGRRGFGLAQLRGSL